MKNRRCFFIGHRNAPESIYTNIVSTIEKLIVENGVKEFIVGNYGMFDSMVIRALQQLKTKYPDIVLLLLTPYHPSVKSVVKPNSFDEIYYPEGMESVPYKAAIIEANKKAISRSEFVIAYFKHSASNTAKFIEYAKYNGVNIYYIDWIKKLYGLMKYNSNFGITLIFWVMFYWCYFEIKL